MDPDVYPAWQHVLSDRKAFVCFRPALALVSCPCVCFSRCVQCPCLKSWTFPHAPPVHEHMGEPEGGEYPADVWCVQKNKKKSKKQSKCGILSERGRWPSSSSSSLSAVFRYNNRFLTTIIFQWRKAFTNFVLFLFVIYSFVFFPSSVFLLLSFAGEMCQNCDSVKMWTQRRSIEHLLSFFTFSRWPNRHDEELVDMFWMDCRKIWFIIWWWMNCNNVDPLTFHFI